MFCTNCGTEIADGVAFCTNCGAPIGQQGQGAQPMTPPGQTPPSGMAYTPSQSDAQDAQQQAQGVFSGQGANQQGAYNYENAQTYGQQAYGQAPYGQQPYPYPQGNAAPQTELGMKWFKFIIYFQLFFSCLANVANAILYFSGAAWTDDQVPVSLVYAIYPALQGLSIFVAIASLALAVADIYVRQQLAHYKKGAPKKYLIILGATIALSVILLIGVTAIVGAEFNSSSSWSSLIINVVVLALNVVYFRKREHLFVN